MQNPQALPFREAGISTSDPDALSSLQPERGRAYVQLARGRFEGVLRERSGFGIGLLYERWSCGVRVRCARPRSYVAFSVGSAEGSARWCGVELEPCSVLELEQEWEITTRGSFESLSFAIERSRLEAVEAALAADRPDDRARDGNRVLGTPRAPALAAVLRARIASALALEALSPESRRVLQDDLTHLAARLRRWGALDRARPESASRRRLAIRRVEEYLDAHAHEVPSIATLCSVAGVSERTLEYAFREQLGVTPIRYLRLRRLNAVRRELRRAEPGTTRIVDAAMRWGFWELGRFAADYRALFGERPSKTLVGRAAMKTEPAP